jgi:glucuronate isomerase
MAHPLTLNPDRLFPAEATTRAVTRRLYESVKDLPIISPHGHVPPVWIADDVPFHDPTSLLLSPDHYINRLMHSHGVSLSTLGVPPGTPMPEAEAREAWRTFCRHWPIYRGTPVRFWMEAELVEIFGVTVRPSEETADAIYDIIQAKINEPSFRPRALMDTFDIAFIATTDDPCDTLEHHQKIAADPSFTRTVAPTFRPDKYLEPARAGWTDLMAKLAQVSGIDTGTYAGWVAANENRRAFFKANGGISTDHSHNDLDTTPLSRDEAERLYAKAIAGQITAAEGDTLRRTMLFEQARMATEDGLVMTLHPAVYRNHHIETFEKYGADVGCDIPYTVEATKALQPMLNAFGTHPNFKVVVFTMDETIFGRELGPMAGFYPAMYVGVPWWFIDAPDAIKRFRKAVSEPAGFTKTSGFIDDTRAFLSIPARHDMSRRLDCVHLAELVVEHRLEEDEAFEVAHDLVATTPRKVFNLD